MWNILAHLPSPALTVAAIAVLGTSVRPVFRYPHMWRYLEARQNSYACTPGSDPLLGHREAPWAHTPTRDSR